MSTTSIGPTTEHMAATYKAIQVTKPGEFETAMKPLVDPHPGQVRIRVEAVGFATPTLARSRGLFPSTGLASRAIK
jgi:alcohol dehydrogenase, propanol-preferring